LQPVRDRFNLYASSIALALCCRYEHRRRKLVTHSGVTREE